ncbi:ComF family protein [Oceanithermus sp.]
MKFEEIIGARCPICAGPLDQPGICTSCESSLTPRRRGNLVYLGSYRELKGAVRRLKYRGGRMLAPPLARALAAGVREAGWDLEAVTAVPTMWWRVWARGYNPAEVLARELARELGLQYAGVLGRRYAPSQTRRARDQRASLRAGTFYVRRELTAGRWLLVDDVWTTGGTFRAVERALRAAGARAVFGAVIAASERPV